jgi:uncharacterized membrane protein YhaH (DUF805 family)
MRWYIDAIFNYVNFKGRERRRAYWMFFLFNIVVATLVSLLDGAFDIKVGATDTGILSMVYAVFIFLPSLAIAVRRLHDTGRSGWWVLINLVPLVGWIIMLVFLCQDSYYGDNEYGPCPKELPDNDLSYNDFADAGDDEK